MYNPVHEVTNAMTPSDYTSGEKLETKAHCYMAWQRIGFLEVGAAAGHLLGPFSFLLVGQVGRCYDGGERQHGRRKSRLRLSRIRMQRSVLTP